MGKVLKMRLNDRGPFIVGRIIDVTPRAASKLGFKEDGLTQVRVEVLSVGDGQYQRKAAWPKILVLAILGISPFSKALLELGAG
jgi:rare lipoprotein A